MAKHPKTPKLRTATKRTTAGRSAKKPKLTAEQKVAERTKREAENVKLKHCLSIQKIFSEAGFTHLTDASDKEFNFQGQSTDLDDIFVYENIVVLAEYTTAKSSNVSAHLKNKKLPFDKILANPASFIVFLRATFPALATSLATNYHLSEIKVRILYCALNNVEDAHQINVPGPIYMNYPAVRYFSTIVDAIKLSARYELINYLHVKSTEIGSGGAVATSVPSSTFKGLVLPEAHSNFAEGYKIVSFYADAAALLSTAYVLRRDGWRDNLNLYQRMISRPKIEAIREYLKKEKRVFINNIIVTLPSDVKPLDKNGNTVDAKRLVQAMPVEILLPARPNSVCVIDGQHRIFAYHQSATDDGEIASLRARQNLLVTGIIYPEGINNLEKEKFEAKLFLEINSTQTNPRPELKQAVGMIISPFAPESIATRVLMGLAKTGPLIGYIQQNFFDESKLKTASIVSYGLKPLVKTSGTDSLFSIWTHHNKTGVTNETDNTALLDYIDFCISKINIILSAFKRNLDDTRWTADKKVPNNIISTSGINGFLIVLRLLIQAGHSLSPGDLNNQLVGFKAFDTSTYSSSQYNQMAEKIVETYFGAAIAPPVAP